ncbi:harmonin-like isoform X2 [Diadema antillarum]|uniref:harmonin-like isoform X2 n=1 Tax=Diadema antillarum TaxID=105358 RepID=UPI003A835936
MDRSITSDFHNRVKSVLELEREQQSLYSSLKKYAEDRDVAALVNAMRDLLVSPDRAALFDDIRPFVSVNQQVEYNNLCPVPPSKKARVVHMTRRGMDPLGFRFRGGLEHGVGLYISEVTPDSQADQKGIKPGDEILQVNGFNVSMVTHNEAFAAMKLKKMLTLKVKSIGLVPIKDKSESAISWQFVESGKETTGPTTTTAVDPNRNIVATERTIFVNLEEGERLGCGISSGRMNRPGIFIHKVNPGTLAEKLGFQVGDEITAVNDTSFRDISHAEALVALKSSTHLNIVLRSWQEDAIQITPQYQPTKDEPETARNAEWVSASKDVPSGLEKPEKPEKSEKPEKPPVKSKEDENLPEWWTKDPYTMFTTRQIDGRELRSVEIVKDGPLEMFLEGGAGTPLMGKIVIAEIMEEGAAFRNGTIFKGDQILMVEGKKLIDVTLEEAQETFKSHMKGALDGSEKLRLITAMAPAKNYEDEVTFF